MLDGKNPTERVVPPKSGLRQVRLWEGRSFRKPIFEEV